MLEHISAAEHQWLHWTISATSNQAQRMTNNAVIEQPPVLAVCLNKVEDGTGRAYDAKNWFTSQTIHQAQQTQNAIKVRSRNGKAVTLDQWWRAGMPPPSKVRAPVTEELLPEVSMQYSFPISKCVQVARDIYATLKSELGSTRKAVVELKFLRWVKVPLLVYLQLLRTNVLS